MSFSVRRSTRSFFNTHTSHIPLHNHTPQHNRGKLSWGKRRAAWTCGTWLRCSGWRWWPPRRHWPMSFSVRRSTRSFFNTHTSHIPLHNHTPQHNRGKLSWGKRRAAWTCGTWLRCSGWRWWPPRRRWPMSSSVHRPTQVHTLVLQPTHTHHIFPHTITHPNITEGSGARARGAQHGHAGRG